MAKIHQILI
jgi:hypothetical protein